MIDFQKPYNREYFLDYLNDFLPDDFEKSKKHLKLNESKIFKNGEILGIVPSLNNLLVIEIERINPEKSRISVTRELFKILNSINCSNSLIVTYSSAETHYRFSYIYSKLEWISDTKVKGNFSNPRRLSFLLGKNQKIHTPTTQLAKLGKITSLDDLENRFDVEILNKEFFNSYKKMYLNLEKALKKDKEFQKFIKKIELKTFLFAKKLLGQIVFCYFLQKKGCLGAKKNTSLNNGDKNFLRNSYEKIKDNDKNFYNDFLEYLFYEGFNKENNNSFVEKLDCKIPYLNGGLFEEINNYNWKKEFISLPNEIFSNSSENGILDILDLYNFTIDENEGLDVEIAIDPEMLGKVFENLLPENLRKTSGSFYTPRKVVSYMCEQSLSNFLLRHFKSEFNKKELDNFLINKDTIINFLELSKDGVNLNRETIVPRFIIENVEKLSEILNNIKICDPAIGSGAFAIGMLQEITKVHKILNHIRNNKFSNYVLKRNFIENNIYGVDLDPGAIEIAKLRLWLSLIIEDDNIDIKPLPNLDFKIIQGDSLTEEFLGITLKIEEKEDKNKQFSLGEQPTLKKNLIKDLYKKQIQYFNLSSLKPKKKLKEEIENLIKEIFILELDKIEIKNSDKKIFKQKISEFGLNYSQRDFFPWSLYFNDVLNNKKGFDIIIGNPPYVDSEEMTKEMPEKRELYNKTYITTKGNWDLYIPFYELGFKLLNENGVLAYIAPNKWLSIKYGNALRSYLNKSLVQICRCEKVNIFEAGNSPSINFFMKSNNISKILVHEFEKKYDFNLIGYVNNSSIPIDNWGLLLSDNILQIVKIRSKFNKKISDYFNVENPFSTSEAYSIKKIIEDRKYSSEHFYFINTGTIDPFITLWGKKNTSYLKSKFLKPVINRNKLKNFSIKRHNQSKSEKLIITAMRYFESFYDKSGNYVAGKSTIIVFQNNKKYSLKSLNVLLNSKFITNYIKSSYSALGIDGGINFSKDIVGQLPLPNNFKKIQKKLENYHNQILDLCNKDMDFKEIKDDSDKFIFKIYESNEHDFI